jgi:WhiB family redox-sensing transcriptional regulator
MPPMPTWAMISALGKAARAANIRHLPDATPAGLRRVWYVTAIGGLAGLSPLTTMPWPPENGEREMLAPTRWHDATVGGQDNTGLSLDLPCTEDPELFFAESPQDVEQAKAMCRGCKARLACLAGALERGEPWGVWGGELLMGGAIVPGKRARGRPRAHSAVKPSRQVGYGR